MSRIDPVSTVAAAFLLLLIALTSWARAELPGATLAWLGGPVMEVTASCVRSEGKRHLPADC